MKNITFILIALLIVSCSPQKRLARLVKKHPELIQDKPIVIHDTTIFRDTITKTIKITIPAIDENFDSKGKDTTMESDNLKVTTKKGKINVFVKPKTIYVHDTIYIDTTLAKVIEVKVPTIVNNPQINDNSFFGKIKKLVVNIGEFLVLVLILSGVVYVGTKFKKN